MTVEQALDLSLYPDDYERDQVELALVVVETALDVAITNLKCRNFGKCFDGYGYVDRLLLGHKRLILAIERFGGV